MPTGGVDGQVASHPSAILLVVQLLGVLVYPFMETGGMQSVVFEIFGALVLALAIWATRESPGPTLDRGHSAPSPRQDCPSPMRFIPSQPWMRPRRCCTHSSTSGPRAA